MPRWKKYSLITGAVILGLMLLSMLVVPWQLKKQGSAWFAAHTTRRLTIEKAFFNPFTLTVEVSGVRLTEQNSDRTFVSLKRLMLSGSISSLLNLAIILDRVELDDPYVNIEMLGKQQFNFSDFTRLSEKPSPPATEQASKPLLFSFNNIVLKGGKIDFTDRTTAKKSQHRIRELSLSIPFIGNIPYLTERYVKPQLRMLLNGSEIRVDGQLKPFAHSLETSLTLQLDDIDLAFYAFHSPIPLPVEVKSGVLNTQLDLSYRVSSTDRPKLLLGGELALTDIELREPDGRELFRLPTLILELDWADLLQQDFNLSSLDIYEPQFYLNRDRLGQWNFQRLRSVPVSAERQESGKTPMHSLPLITIDKLQLIDGQLHYRDDFVPDGFSEEVRGINLTMNALTTLREATTGLQFHMQTDRGLTAELSGDIGLNPVSGSLNLLVNGLPLHPYYPYLQPYLSAPPDGSLNLASGISYSANGNLQLQQAQLALHNLQLPFTGEDHFTLGELAVTGGRLNLRRRQLSVDEIKFSAGQLQASRLADGSLSPLKLLKPQTKTTEPVVADNSPPWQIKVGKLALQQFDLLLSDASLARKPHLKIDRLNLEIQDLAYPESAQSPFRLSANIGRKGTVAVSGKLAHSPLRLQTETRIQALPLAAFNDFLPEKIKVSLKDGQLYSTLALKLGQTPEALTGNFAGRLNISNLNLRDPLSGGILLAWEGLDVNGIKGRLAPFSLRIKQVALNNYQTNILINRDGRINLTSVTATEPEPTPQTQAEASPSEPPVATDTSGSPPDIRVDALTLQGGTVSFTDRHLPSTFSTTMYQLGGRITGMASNENMQADVDLRGQLENHSPLTVSGKLNPLSQDLFADLTIRFEDIDLAPLTPYSGTYLGYVIDKGKLYLNLSYHIEHHKIDADNRIMIDQFTFGAPVKSDQATSLPVSLAIALLKDRNGEIHLNVPVSGNLDDPSFSVAGAVFTIFKNLLVKAATSPFSLLASMFGGEEDFSSVAFASGSSKLSELDQQKLAKLAEILAQRPALILEISGYVDQQNDPEGYRRIHLRQLVADAKWRQLREAGKAPKSPDQVVVSAKEYPGLVTTVYREAKFPRPRNFIGMLKELPVPEMAKLLLANVVVGKEQLMELAKQRALQVRDALAAQDEKIKPQLFLKQTDIDQAPKKGPASRVEFHISSK